MLAWNGKCAILLGGLTLASAVALAQEPPERDRRGGVPWDSPRIKEQLGLTDEQITKLKAQSFEAAKERVKMGSQVRLAEIELRQLMEASSPDEKAVAAKAKEIGDLQGRLYQARVAQRLALRKMLTAEQQQKLRELGPQRRRERREPGEDHRRRRLPEEFRGLDPANEGEPDEIR